jgi:hypothetical protein
MFERRVSGSCRGLGVFALFVVVTIVCLVIPTVASAQVAIKVNDNINFKLGALVQSWGDAAQDSTTGAYAKNLFLRRMRFIVGGQISPNISFFFETDNPNLGKAPKALGSGFITQDAFIEWKPVSNAFILDGGLMLPPLCRNCLESAATLLSLDYGTFSFLEGAPTQSSVGRDTGFQAKGYLAGGHFEYRAGVFQGFRGAGSRNGFRTTGRAQYDVWDTETGYVYPGLYHGNKKILAFGVGGDHQQNYKAYSADAFLSRPLANKDTINGELTLLRFNGGVTLPTLLPQNDATLQAGYYLAASKVMPWGRYERQSFRNSVDRPKNNNRLQAGLTYFPNGNNFNIKGAVSRVNPRTGRKTSEYTVQMQFFYY